MTKTEEDYFWFEWTDEDEDMWHASVWDDLEKLWEDDIDNELNFDNYIDIE